MDTKLLTIIDNMDEYDITSLIGKLPQATKKTYNDEISTELFWVLYNTNIPKATKNRLLDFAIQNIVSHTTTENKLIDTLQHKITRLQIVNKIVWNPWLIAEYFLLDYLKRSPLNQKQSGEKISIKDHIKSTPEQDETRKIDFLSHIWHWPHTYNIGMQLTTTTQHQLTYKSGLVAKENQFTASGKKLKVNTLSQNIWKQHHKDVPETYKKYVPHMLWYMVINWWIDHILNKEKNNFLADAYKKRMHHWYPAGWPTKFMRKDMHELFSQIALHYQTSLTLCWNAIQQKAKDPSHTFEKKIFDKGNIKYIETYKPQVDELLYEFFTGNFATWETSLLFSVSYFINQHMIDIAKKNDKKKL